jgi:hypothetical protein
MGVVRSGLAVSWRLDADGRTWIVTLRENARFADGTLVTADQVRASWIANAAGDSLRPDVRRLVESAVVLDERTLAVVLSQPRVDEPIALAHPDLAIAKPISGSSWPLGTRSGRITPLVDEPSGKRAALVLARVGLPPIHFLPPASDHRDFLDAGVDLLLTREPAAVDYARTLPHVQMVPLAWHRTQVLLIPGRSPLPFLSQQDRQELATDAVRGEARGAQGPFWWQAWQGCGLDPSAPQSQGPPVSRIVYDASDTVAREVAGRFVGVGTYERAAGLTGGALAQALRLGADDAYLRSVNIRSADPCRDLHELVDAAPWLDPETIVPLIETRLQAVVRRGRSGLSAEWDGGITIAGEVNPKR